VLEVVARDAEHDVRVHLDEPAVGVVCETRAAALPGEGDDRAVVEAEVQDGLHHPRHRHGRARSDGNQERIRRIAEPAAGRLLQSPHVRRHVVAKAVDDLAVAEVVDAGRARDREAWRDRDAKIRHLGEVRALAAEHVAHLARALGRTVTEEVDEHRATEMTR
jgi:hypothetical protein